jgi:glycosyltransferase involved in cell wall biosynthesis
MSQLDGLTVTLAFNRLFKKIDRSDLPVPLSDESAVANQIYPYKVIRRLLRPNPLYLYPYDLFYKNKADIFHGTNFTHIPVTKGKTVITIHDLAYMRYPETTSERIYKHHSRWVPYSARKCHRIIADSEQTKRDIVDLLQIPESKIDVIYLAADEKMKPVPETDVKPILQKYHLPERYLLFVGTLEPRKNLIGLLKAYRIMKQNCDYTEKLVIIGAKGWKYDPVFDWVERHNMQNDVIFTGFIEDQDLVAIYNGATVFVMPSLYEGFGLPILEAMNCGIPVIGSNVSSIPEVIGDAGILVAPDDHEAWAVHMHRLLVDESLRRTYSMKSLERSKRFSWQKTAYETKLVYDKMMNA